MIEFRIRASRGDFSFGDDDIKLYAYQKNGRKLSVASPLELVERKDKERFSGAVPMATMDNQAAQCLMNDLWECGLRPSEGTGSAGSLAATQQHLDSMKTIAFHVLKIGKEKS